jgi:predicted phosphodiesterase
MTPRRRFLKMTGATTLTLATGLRAASISGEPLRIGLISDVHYADLDIAGTRHYRDSISKVRQAVEVFNRSELDLVVCLGDMIDSGKTVAVEYAHLETIFKEFQALKAECRFVLGNHCVWSLNKSEFLRGVQQKRSYDSMTIKGMRIIMLDACFRQDGEAYGRQNYRWTDTDIPKEEQSWLKSVLALDPRPTLVFVHQRLDVSGNYGVHSAPAVRAILEASGQVVAVFQGHNHVNDHRVINHIHYVTMNAVIEGPAPANNAFAVMEYAAASGAIRIDGWHDQSDYSL